MWRSLSVCTARTRHSNSTGVLSFPPPPSPFPFPAPADAAFVPASFAFRAMLPAMLPIPPASPVTPLLISEKFTPVRVLRRVATAHDLASSFFFSASAFVSIMLLTITPMKRFSSRNVVMVMYLRQSKAKQSRPNINTEAVQLATGRTATALYCTRPSTALHCTLHDEMQRTGRRRLVRSRRTPPARSPSCSQRRLTRSRPIYRSRTC